MNNNNIDTIVIRYGFKAINFITKRDMMKGRQLHLAGHVLDVQEKVLTNGNFSVITAKVIRQTSINLPPYQVELQVGNIFSTRDVTRAICQCIAGLCGDCKHVHAVATFINNEISTSKTSYGQQWGAPSEKSTGKEKYAKGRTFEELFPRKKPSSNVYKPVEINFELVQNINCNLRSALLAESISESVQLCMKLVNELCDKSVYISEKRFCLQAVQQCLDQQDVLLESVITFKNETIMCFYHRRIAISKDTAIYLALETRSQSESQRWFLERKLRISATKAHRIKSRKAKDFEKLTSILLEEPKKKLGRAAINCKYGLEQEKNAIINYEQSFKLRTTQCGLIIHNKQPWLCASPDALVVDHNGNVIKVLEVKSPISCKNKLIIEDSGRINVSYLNEGGLKKSHEYYTQCQILMYCTGLNASDFYVYSPLQSVCYTILRDNAFLNVLTEKIHQFYFNFYLSKLQEICHDFTAT